MYRILKSNSRIVVLGLLAMLPMVSHLQAAIVENIALGNAKAIALGNAVTADAPGIDSIHYNPAGLTQLRGRQYQFKVLTAGFNFRVDFGDHDASTQQVHDQYGYHDEASNNTSETSTIASKMPFKDGIDEWPLPFLIAPFGGAAYTPPGSNVTFATAVYAPISSGYIREADDPGRFLGQEMALTKITYFSPSIAVRLDDAWSLGFSLGFSWQGLGALNQFRIPNIALVIADQLVAQLYSQDLCPSGNNSTPIIDLCGARVGPYTEIMELSLDTQDDLVLNANVGVQWQPTPWFSWGFVYQHESVAHTEGTYEVTYRDEWVNFFSDLSRSTAWQALNRRVPLPSGRQVESGKAKVDLVLPTHIATGISLKLTPVWKVNIDVRRSDWGSWESLDIQFDDNLDFLKLAALFGNSEGNLLSLPRGYRSVWNWGFGVEYQYSHRLALRFGYEPRKSSIPAHKQDTLLPLGDAQMFGTGFVFQTDHDQYLEFGFGYLLAKADVPAGTSTNANSTDQRHNIVYNPYAGTDFTSEVKAYFATLRYQTHF